MDRTEQGTFHSFWKCLWFFLWVEPSGCLNMPCDVIRGRVREFLSLLLGSPTSFSSGLKTCFARKLHLVNLEHPIKQLCLWDVHLPPGQQPFKFLSLFPIVCEPRHTELLDPHPVLSGQFIFLETILLRQNSQLAHLKCLIQWQTLLLSLQPLLCFHTLSFLQGQEWVDGGTQTWLELILRTFLTKAPAG